MESIAQFFTAETGAIDFALLAWMVALLGGALAAVAVFIFKLASFLGLDTTTTKSKGKKK